MSTQRLNASASSSGSSTHTSYTTSSNIGTTLNDTPSFSSHGPRNRKDQPKSWPLTSKVSSSALSTISSSSTTSTESQNKSTSSFSAPSSLSGEDIVVPEVEPLLKAAGKSSPLVDDAVVENSKAEKRKGCAAFDWTYRNAVVAGKESRTVGYGRQGLVGGGGRGSCDIM